MIKRLFVLVTITAVLLFTSAQPSRASSSRLLIGDSIAAWWSLPGVSDQAVAGYTSKQMVALFKSQQITGNWTEIVVLVGTNDIATRVSLTDYAANITQLGTWAKYQRIRLILCSVLPVGENYTAERPTISILAYNAWLRLYAAVNGFTYLDFYTPMANSNGLAKTGLLKDGLHPSSAGYAIMTPMALTAMGQ